MKSANCTNNSADGSDLLTTELTFQKVARDSIKVHLEKTEKKNFSTHKSFISRSVIGKVQMKLDNKIFKNILM